MRLHKIYDRVIVSGSKLRIGKLHNIILASWYSMILLSKKLFLLFGLCLVMPNIAVDDESSQSSENDSSPSARDIHAIIPTSNERIQYKPLSVSPINHKTQEQETVAPLSVSPIPDWLIRSSIKNATPLLRGVLCYLESLPDCAIVSSFHRLILVGPPGTGKTTLARAIACRLGYSSVYIAATELLGKYRNQTAVNIRNFFNTFTKDGRKKIIIVDELHKLFESHENERTDHSENAAAFWLVLDNVEKHYPNIIIIGTANDASKLPPEIKSRFHGKIITMPLPDKQQKIQAFKDSVNHDRSVLLDSSVDDAFIARIVTQSQDCSLRDVQLLIDTAKMFKYAEDGSLQGYHVTLGRTHFEQAVQKLRGETEEYKEDFVDRTYPRAKKWALFISMAINSIVLSKRFFDAVKWFQLIGSPML